MSAHLETLVRRAMKQALVLVPCRSHGVTRYALIRYYWHLGMPVLWYSTLQAVEEALTC